MTFRIWKSSGLINHLFFSSLFLLTPLFFEHQENLSVPLFAPRTPFSQVSSSLAHGLVAYRFAARSRTSRSPRLAATPSVPRSVLFPPAKTGTLSRPCLRFSPASAVSGLRSRIASVSLRRNARLPPPSQKKLCGDSSPVCRPLPQIRERNSKEQQHNSCPLQRADCFCENQHRTDNSCGKFR